MRLFFVLICLGIALPALAWQPTGSIDELHDPALLPRLRPGVVQKSFSSYDRTGGNNDGFSGAYSKLREEDGNSVIAEMEGPGCIQRMWFTHSGGEKPGLLNYQQEHIKIYLDGNETPALDVPLESLFDNSLERFPDPIAGQGIGGFYCYVPIPYRESCKVVIEGTGVRFYQLNYATFPSAEGVKNFSMELTAEERESLQLAVDLWSNPLETVGHYGYDIVEADVTYEPLPDKPFSFTICEPGAPLTLVRGISVEGLPDRVLEDGQIEIRFDNPKVESIKAPLKLFFGQSFRPQPFQSLCFGSRDGVYYNLVPFIGAEACTLTFHSIYPFEGKVTAYTQALEGPAQEFGRLAVQVNENLPTMRDVHHPFLQTTGSGHYAGTFMVTEGPKGLPFWLEGDDKWTIDGELRIHGTGSEDYFNCGWYALEGRLDKPGFKPAHGFPIYGETEDTMRATAYRWHWADPVPFSNSIDAVIEHGEANKHIANYRSIVWYYRVVQ